MNPYVALGLVALLALGLPLLAWYVYVRIKLANNPNLIRAGVGSVKVALFLRLQRLHRERPGAGEKDVGLLAAAVVNALFGETPKDGRVAAYAAQNGEQVETGLRSLAAEPAPIRGLIAAALRFQSKLPASLAGSAADSSQASLRAQELGITASGGRPMVLWQFAKEAAGFLRSEHRQMPGRGEPPTP